jgi:phosphoglucosamine mutase
LKAEKELAANGRVLVRASGTEPLVRVMVEANDLNIAQSTADSLAQLVKSELQ